MHIAQNAACTKRVLPCYGATVFKALTIANHISLTILPKSFFWAVTPFAAGFGMTTLVVPAEACGGRKHFEERWASAITLLEKLTLLTNLQMCHRLPRCYLDGCCAMYPLRSKDS